MKKRIVIAILVTVVAVAILAGYRIYNAVMKPNVVMDGQQEFSLLIPTGADFGQVKDSLYVHQLIADPDSFEWWAQQRGYPDHVKAGRYVLRNGMSNRQLCNLLNGGLQTPVKVTFNNMRDIPMLAGRIATQIEADSLEIADYLNDPVHLAELGFTPQTLPAMFLPNTYEFYWNTSAAQFVERMKKEYDSFWTAERLEKAKDIALNPVQVSTLASIVDKETNKTDEMARIAGVYLNRLRNGWLLQADPTLVFAVGDFGLKRVLNVHKEIESPYNTYKYLGLPPGPICIPSLAAINAVLNAEKHNFYYFCAKDDLSGYHVFAKTLTEHNRNAERYHRKINSLK